MVLDYGRRIRDEAERVLRCRARSQRISNCDAISFVVVKSMLNDMPCLAFDRDCRTLGLTVIS
jgi:hypothetical protein